MTRLKRAGWVVGLILLYGAAIAARLHGLSEESLWYDETASVQSLDAHSLSTFLAEVRGFDTPMVPVYFVTQYAWANLVLGGVLGLRLLSLLLSIAAMAALHRFTTRLYGPWAGWIAAALFAFSNIHIFYGQEIRVYSMVMLWAILVVNALDHALSGESWRWWVWHTVFSALLMWTHILAVLLLAPIGLFLLLRRPRFVPVWCLAQSPAVLLLAWWIRGIDFITLDDAAAYMTRPSAGDFLRGITWCATFTPYPVYGAWAVGVVALGWALAASRVWSARFDGATYRRERDHLLLLGLWLIGPPLLLFLLSWAHRPMFVMRYWLYCSPAFFALMAAGVSAQYVRRVRPQLTVVLAVLLGAHLFSEARPFRPGWRTCARVVQSNQHPGDVVLKFPDWDKITLNFYAPELNIETGDLATHGALMHRVGEETTRGNVVWLIYARQAPQGDLTSFEESLRFLGVRYDRFPASFGQPTFVYMGLARHTLRHKYGVAVYRITGALQAEVPPAS